MDLVEVQANYLDETGEIKQNIKNQLCNYAIETYKDIMLNAKAASDRKNAADAVLELLGKKNKTGTMSANLNFNIPPEYFKKVFGEGLQAVTAVVADAEFREVQNG